MEQLGCLSTISVLELRDNKIQAVPEEIAVLSTLTRLDLTNNDIKRWETNKNMSVTTMRACFPQ